MPDYATGHATSDPYEDAITTPCPRCRVGEGSKCRNPETGKEAHCPCVSRLASRMSDTQKHQEAK